MSIRFAFLSVLLAVLPLPSPLQASGTEAVLESFESGLPQSYESSGGSLSTSTDAIQDGDHSLRWEFKDGDSFVIRTGPLGNVNVWTGYGGYSRSALALPVYLTAQGKGHLLIEIRAGEETAATIEVPFVHVGWQKLVYHYTSNSHMKWLKGNLKDKLDNLRISAHGIEGKHTAYFDAIRFNIPLDFREGRDAITQPWAPQIHDFSALAAPTDGDLAKMEELSRLLTPQPNPGVTRASWEQRVSSLRKRIEDEGLHKGKPITKNLAHYFDFLSGIATAWNQCADPEMKDQLAACFHTTNDWLQEQGLVANGALGAANNYIGRTYVDAVTRMREPLAAHGTLEASINYIKWSYNYDDQLFGDHYDKSMDYFHNEAFRILLIALTHGDPVERWHHVARFRESLGKQLIASIKADGAIFHHGFHYFAYGSMGMSDASWLAATLSQAGLPVSREALGSIRTALESMLWYCGRSTLWSLAGRNASGTQSMPHGTLLNLARAYAPYNDGKPDAALLANFLRFQPDRAKDAEFSGIAPASAPTGHRVMPFAALGMQRRDHWLAGVKGYSKYAASGESYAEANRFGYFMSMGQLELLTHPAPLPTVLGSGTRPDEGYDWCAIEGATTIHCPISRIANGNGTRIPHSGESFVGGLSNRSNGLFALTYNNGITGQIMGDRPKDAPAPDPLRALKTWFFFDNRIVCLASDISTKNVSFPVRTNLFQKFLTGEFTTTRLDGEPITLAAETIERDAESPALVDPYGNAYFTAPGTKVHLRVGQQSSRNNNDSKDTTGNYATAWIEHGLNPQNAGYEYTVLVQPTDAQVRSFNPAAACTVIQKDANAHIVRDRATGTTGYVIFNAQAPLPEATPLVSVAQPCLVMVEEHGDHLNLAVTNPDLRPGESAATPVSITLKGEYSAASGQGAEVTASSGTTTITVPVTHGESVTMRLAKPALALAASAETTDTPNASRLPTLLAGVLAAAVLLAAFLALLCRPRSAR